MTIRYRKQTATGDYTFGQSQDDFFTGIKAVTQACVTRLKLWQGSWWRDINDGTPYLQQILGTRGGRENLIAIESIIQGRILGTQDVTAINNVQYQFNPDTRSSIFTGQVQTAYSEAPFELEF